MTEMNWSLAEQGATVVEVSHEAAHVASMATNLLSSKEEKLWITGDAPQHVVLRLSPQHPPLWYAGWHVWHDYLTNPKTVEIASGASPEVLKALLVCEALPGAGTQVWKLPTAIPPEHTIVRFKIIDTFGPGPTYMNNIVLLARDPGPRYRCSSDSYPQGASAGLSSPSVPLLTSSAPNPNNTSLDNGGRASQLPYGRGMRDRDADLVASRHPETPNSDVGLSVRGESTHLQNPNISRMNDLLKGLDEDIRALKPIKTVSPSKNMLMYVPAEAPSLPPLEFSVEEEEEEEVEESPPKRAKKKTHKSRRNSGEPRLYTNPAPVYYSAPPPSREYVPLTFESRLSTLEQAVASLSQSVQHQREDLIMIKRLLLQQATDKRHELERLMRKEKENNPSVAAPAALTKRSLDQFPFAHQQVSVDFPEDALRAFVEKVMEEKINKVSKRCERKLKEQSQVQMDGMLQQMMAEIERRFEDVRSSPLTANPHAQTVKFAQNGMGNRTFVSSLGEAHAPSTANTSRLFGGSLSPFHQYGPISIVKDASHLSSRNGQQ